MSGRDPSRYSSPRWRPRVVHDIVLAVAEQMEDAGLPMPPAAFYRTLSEHAESAAQEWIADAIAQAGTESADADLAKVRHLLDTLGDELFIGTELAVDATLARLLAYLLVDCTDGYNYACCDLHWGMNPDPEWGTRWGIHQDIRDLSPAFLFKLCRKGDVRFLAVECHAPTRRLPEDAAARLRARTLIVSGVPVLAFSPAEIEGDPAACVAEIGNALAILAQELLALHGIEPPPRHDFRPRTGA